MNNGILDLDLVMRDQVAWNEAYQHFINHVRDDVNAVLEMFDGSSFKVLPLEANNVPEMEIKLKAQGLLLTLHANPFNLYIKGFTTGNGTKLRFNNITVGEMAGSERMPMSDDYGSIVSYWLGKIEKGTDRSKSQIPLGFLPLFHAVSNLAGIKEWSTNFKRTRAIAKNLLIIIQMTVESVRSPLISNALGNLDKDETIEWAACGDEINRVWTTQNQWGQNSLAVHRFQRYSKKLIDAFAGNVDELEWNRLVTRLEKFHRKIAVSLDKAAEAEALQEEEETP